MFIDDTTAPPPRPLHTILARFPDRWPADAVALAELHALAVSADEDWVAWLDDAAGATALRTMVRMSGPSEPADA